MEGFAEKAVAGVDEYAVVGLGAEVGRCIGTAFRCMGWLWFSDLFFAIQSGIDALRAVAAAAAASAAAAIVFGSAKVTPPAIFPFIATPLSSFLLLLGSFGLLLDSDIAI